MKECEMIKRLAVVILVCKAEEGVIAAPMVTWRSRSAKGPVKNAMFRCRSNIIIPLELKGNAE